MVLVEQGPWSGPVEDHLHSLQARLYGCLEAALDGQVAAKFPQSKGLTFVIQVDCYDLPPSRIEDLVRAFEDGISDLPDYDPAGSPFVGGFQFTVNHQWLTH